MRFVTFLMASAGVSSFYSTNEIVPNAQDYAERAGNESWRRGVGE
jgi:hypothetical protein